MSRGSLLLLPLLVITASCTRVEQARRCGELTETVNPRLASVRQLTQGSQTPAHLRNVAEHYDGIADDLGPLEFHSQALALAVKEYGRQLRAVAAEARKAAEAVDSEDREAYRTARHEVRMRSVQIRAAQRRIEEACK